jgi:hypothetical protein
MPLGIYIDDTVLVVQPRGQGLGVELGLRCVPHRTIPGHRRLTQAGLATLTKAYYMGVGRAIDLERIPVMFEHSRHGERSSCILVG